MSQVLGGHLTPELPHTPVMDPWIQVRLVTIPAPQDTVTNPEQVFVLILFIREKEYMHEHGRGGGVGSRLPADKRLNPRTWGS